MWQVTTSRSSARRSTVRATTYRSGARFGPQGHAQDLRTLYGSFSFELGVDLRESITICDLGDIFVDTREHREDF